MATRVGPSRVKDRQGNTEIEDAIEERLQPGQLRAIQIECLIDDLNFRPLVVQALAKVSDQTIRNWRSEKTSGPLPEYLDDVRAISIRMVRDRRVPFDRIGPWFDARNDHLERDAKPWKMIVAGRYEDVLEASRCAWGAKDDEMVREDAGELV